MLNRSATKMRYLKLSNIINRSILLYNHGFLKPIKSTQLIKSNYCQRTQYKKLNLTCVYNLSSSTYPKCINQSKIYQMFIRLKHTNTKTEEEKRVKSILMYLTAVAVLIVGLSYAAVPMYRIFCQATSYGGEISRDVDTSKVESMKKIEDRQIKIHFNADTSSSMQWNFKPQQREIVLVPGDTALAFYTATNPTDEPVVGISTYNVIPFDAGQYFNKIQCFCFEEQRLNPHEQVDMPVFFYIDPEFAEDPKMENVKEIILSYTFFEARDGLQLPVPSYYRN